MTRLLMEAYRKLSGKVHNLHFTQCPAIFNEFLLTYIYQTDQLED